jgi:hypothetical protein
MKRSEALKIRGRLEAAVQLLPEQEALEMKNFYPEWAPGREYPAEISGQPFKFRYGGQLYKVITAHTSQADWPPDVTAALYTRIDETHSGSQQDPIPYGGNMALSAGLYYTQGGVVYHCTRDTVNPVHNALIDLVGLYVEQVKED